VRQNAVEIFAPPDEIAAKKCLYAGDSSQKHRGLVASLYGVSIHMLVQDLPTEGQVLYALAIRHRSVQSGLLQGGQSFSP
jgi:hypothetical protein